MDEPAATKAIYGALREIQERLDLRNSELVTATLGALVRITPMDAHRADAGQEPRSR